MHSVIVDSGRVSLVCAFTMLHAFLSLLSQCLALQVAAATEATPGGLWLKTDRQLVPRPQEFKLSNFNLSSNIKIIRFGRLGGCLTD